MSQYEAFLDLLRTCIHTLNWLTLTHTGRDSNWSAATHGEDRQIKNIERRWRVALKNRQNGRSRDLSVMAMNTDKPTLWIMFLSQSSLITVFLVKTNPLISERSQNAGMFIANSWKEHTKRVSRQADPLTSLPLSLDVRGKMQRKRQNERKEFESVHQAERKGGKEKDGSFKHTRAGIACQNTLPSSNWVIFDTPFHTLPAYWWGGVRMPRACEASLALNQSRHKCCPQTIWQAQAHTGARTSKNMAQQLPPVPPGRNCYMGIPKRFQRRELNPHVYYEIGYFVPPPPHPSASRPVCNPSTDLALSVISLPSFPSTNQLPVCLSLWNRPRFDHNILGCEGGQGCLIFTPDKISLIWVCLWLCQSLDVYMLVCLSAL